MKTKKLLLCAILATLLGVPAVYAQNSATTSSTTTPPSIPEGVQRVTTENGDELCVLSTGNSIPCEFYSEIEENVQTKSIFEDKDTGIRYCYTEDSLTLVDCSWLDKNHKVESKFLLQNIKNNQIINKNFFINFYKLEIITIVILLLLLVFGTVLFLIKKIRKSKDKKIISIIVLLSFSAFSTSKTFADIPIQSPATVYCTCATSAADTCITVADTYLQNQYWFSSPIPTEPTGWLNGQSAVTSCTKDTNIINTEYLPLTQFVNYTNSENTFYSYGNRNSSYISPSGASVFTSILYTPGGEYIGYDGHTIINSTLAFWSRGQAQDQITNLLKKGLILSVLDLFTSTSYSSENPGFAWGVSTAVSCTRANGISGTLRLTGATVVKTVSYPVCISYGLGSQVPNVNCTPATTTTSYSQNQSVFSCY